MMFENERPHKIVDWLFSITEKEAGGEEEKFWGGEEEESEAIFHVPITERPNRQFSKLRYASVDPRNLDAVRSCGHFSNIQLRPK